MKKVTKKQVVEATKTKKGEGFNPQYQFECHINDTNFEKPFGFNNIFVSQIIDDNGRVDVTEIWDVKTKSDFVNAVVNFFNK